MCGRCNEVCEFGAIAVVPEKVMLFPELCHGCGGCAQACPVGAITEVPREVGVVEIGRAGRLDYVQGRMNVGQAMSPPVIRAVKRHVAFEGVTVIDCPPGTSCPLLTAVKGSDFVLLVTEPTPFGLHDLKLAVETMRLLQVEFGIAINRADIGDTRVEEYCRDEGIRVLARMPDSRRIAEAYARGRPAVEALPELKSEFARIHEAITEALEGAASARKEEKHANV